MVSCNPRSVDVRVLCCPGVPIALSGSLGLDCVQVSGIGRSVCKSSYGPASATERRQGWGSRDISEAVPRDHDLPQGLSVWAILPLELCIGPTVK